MTYVNAISKKSNFRNFFMISLHIGSTVSKLDFFLKFWSCRVYFVYCLRNVQFLKFKKSGIPVVFVCVCVCGEIFIGDRDKTSYANRRIVT